MHRGSVLVWPLLLTGGQDQPTGGALKAEPGQMPCEERKALGFLYSALFCQSYQTKMLDAPKEENQAGCAATV